MPSLSYIRFSPAIDAGESDDAAAGANKRQRVTDFFDKVPAAAPAKKPAARKVSGSADKPKPAAPTKKVPAKKKLASSDDDMDDDGPVVVPARARAARAGAKKSYLEVLSDEDDGGGKDDSIYEIESD